MTSPINNKTPNDWSKDPMWGGGAQTEREAEHKSNRQSDMLK